MKKIAEKIIEEINKHDNDYDAVEEVEKILNEYISTMKVNLKLNGRDLVKSINES